MNWNTVVYILGGIASVASAAAAYFGAKTHAILNSGKTIQLSAPPAVKTPEPPLNPATMTDKEKLEVMTAWLSQMKK